MRYYSTQRPIGPGTYPKKGAKKIVNFDRRMPDESFKQMAWGYIEYNRELTKEEVNDYELVRGGKEET